jgi:cytidine deaminase
MDRDLSVEEFNKIVDAAIAARANAYVPYSGFSVGAALLAENGEVITGCNVENASYPAGLCAERVAIFSAVAKGLTKYRAIAVSGGMKGQAPADYCMPCGMCLQVMSEFCDPSFKVYIVKGREEVLQYQLRDLLPETFKSLPI